MQWGIGREVEVEGLEAVKGNVEARGGGDKWRGRERVKKSVGGSVNM